MRTTGHNGSRRAFLTGRLKRPEPTPSLPWVLRDQFWDRCTRCGDCAAACPEDIIKPGSGSYPEISFADAGCTFCGDCARACPEALFSDPSGRPWDQVARIGETCLMAGNVFCQSCAETCAEEAIAFDWTAGRTLPPKIDADRCTGCGQCVAPCPVDAITVASGRETRGHV